MSNDEVVLVRVGLIVMVPVQGKLFSQNAQSLASNLKITLAASPQDLYGLMLKGQYGIETLEATPMRTTEAQAAISSAYMYLNAANTVEEEEEEDND